MATDSPSMRLASVILRATLAVIFIWHGLDKVIGSKNVWGANWAGTLWLQKSEPPPEVMAKLAKLEAKDWLEDDETGELAEEQIEALAARRLTLTRDRLHRAYSQAAEVPPPLLVSHAVQYMVAWGELVGGVALVLGVLTRLAAAGLLIIQLGAIYFVTGTEGLTKSAGVGYEYNLVLAAVCLVLVVLGPGAWSVDHFLHWRKRKAPEPASVPVAVP